MGANREVIMPSALTAESGAKLLMTGEFFEEVEVSNPNFCGCGECIDCLNGDASEQTTLVRVQVSWTTIKAIYAMAVKHLGHPILDNK